VIEPFTDSHEKRLRKKPKTKEVNIKRKKNLWKKIKKPLGGGSLRSSSQVFPRGKREGQGGRTLAKEAMFSDAEKTRNPLTLTTKKKPPFNAFIYRAEGDVQFWSQSQPILRFISDRQEQGRGKNIYTR